MTTGGDDGAFEPRSSPAPASVSARYRKALVERGWAVVAHVRDDGDAVPEGADEVAAELADAGCADAIFAAADGLPPMRLLVNNAGAVRLGRPRAIQRRRIRRAHGRQRPRAGAADPRVRAAAAGGDALVVNILDFKLPRPTPISSATRCPSRRWPGSPSWRRGRLPGRIRVNAIAPSLMLRSAGQSERNFAAMHARNPLGRGVTPDHVVAAFDYLLACDAVTGEVLTIDGGQPSRRRARDVQFLEGE